MRRSERAALVGPPRSPCRAGAFAPGGGPLGRRGAGRLRWLYQAQQPGRTSLKASLPMEETDMTYGEPCECQSVDALRAQEPRKAMCKPFFAALLGQCKPNEVDGPSKRVTVTWPNVPRDRVSFSFLAIAQTRTRRKWARELLGLFDHYQGYVIRLLLRSLKTVHGSQNVRECLGGSTRGAPSQFA